MRPRRRDQARQIREVSSCHPYYSRTPVGKSSPKPIQQRPSLNRMENINPESTSVANVAGESAGAPEPKSQMAVQSVHKVWTLLAYGGLALPLCIAGIPIVVYLPAFYAQELHFKTSFVGTVFLLARLWDGFSDVIVGWLSDRSMSRWGR